MTIDEQLDKWVAGKPIHNNSRPLLGGECCPDFSCCKPALLAAPETRLAFKNADQKGREKMLMKFLAVMLQTEGHAVVS